MKGYDILGKLRSYSPGQLDSFLQYFLGQIGMDLEGFTDSQRRLEYYPAKMMFDAIDSSIRYVANMRIDCPKHGCNMEAIRQPGETGCFPLRCPMCLHEATPFPPKGYCSKHGCNMIPSPGHENHVDCGQVFCPMCKHEADHPPIKPKGSEELSAEELQQLHRQHLVATADSIEPAQTKKASCLRQAEPAQERYACYDCGCRVFKLGTPESDIGRPLGYVNADDNLRCLICSQLFIGAREEEVLKESVEAAKQLTTIPHHHFNSGTKQYEACYSHDCPDAKRINETPKQEMIDGLLVSTDTLSYHMIPVIAIERLCERIMLGEQTKGKDAWNALSDNQSVLDSRKALARRFGHTINHAYRLLGKLQWNEPWTEEDEKEASAVMWGGMFAICAINQQRKKQE